jgi:hypothetical protein
MKTFLIVLCLAACILAGIGIEEEKEQFARSWSLADPLIALCGAICLTMFLSGKWRTDQTSLFIIATGVVLAASASANGEWKNGTLLNMGRTVTSDAILYVIMFNVVRDVRALRRFCWLILATAAVIFQLSIPTLMSTWSLGFTNILYTFGAIDLNTFGFSCVILFCASAPLWLSWREVFRGFLVGTALASGALLSFSRSAWTNLLIAAGFMAVLRGNTSSRQRVTRIVTMGLGLIAAFFIINSVTSLLPDAAQFGKAKINDYGIDVVDTRLDELTLKPVLEWSHEPVVTILIGDATSIQHTFVANSVWTTGLFGLLCGAGTYWTMGWTAIAALRKASLKEHRLTAACFLALVVVMFLDDSVTNHRFHAPFISYLFFATAGAFSGLLRENLQSERAAAVPSVLMGTYTVAPVTPPIPPKFA